MVCHLWTGLFFFLFSPCASAAVDGKSSITQLLISGWWNVDTAPERHPGTGWRCKLSSNRRWWQSNATLHHLQWVACKGAGRGLFAQMFEELTPHSSYADPALRAFTQTQYYSGIGLSVGHSLLFKGYQSRKVGEGGGAVGQIRCVTKNKQPQLTTTLPRGQGVCPNHSWLPLNSRYTCKTNHYACKLVSLNAWQTRMGGNPTD